MKTKLLIFNLLCVSVLVFANENVFTNSLIFVPTTQSQLNINSQSQAVSQGGGDQSRSGEVAKFSTGTVIKHDVKRMSGKKDYAHIVLVIDASGSMSPFRAEMIQACKYFFKTQRDIKGNVTLDVWTFSSQARSPYIEKIVDFKPLTGTDYLNDYFCSGLTPLYDAVYNAIDDVNKKIINLKKTKRNPEIVIFVIVSDGLDNLSTRNICEVSNAITSHLEEWNFLMLGIGEKIGNIGTVMGISAQNCFNVVVNDPTQISLLWQAITEFSKRSRMK